MTDNRTNEQIVAEALRKMVPSGDATTKRESQAVNIVRDLTDAGRLTGGAFPETEGEWTYRARLKSCGFVTEGYISAEYAMEGLKSELEEHPYLVMDDTAIVERTRVREWLPVEGESR